MRVDCWLESWINSNPSKATTFNSTLLLEPNIYYFPHLFLLITARLWGCDIWRKCFRIKFFSLNGSCNKRRLKGRGRIFWVGEREVKEKRGAASESKEGRMRGPNSIGRWEHQTNTIIMHCDLWGLILIPFTSFISKH